MGDGLRELPLSIYELKSLKGMGIDYRHPDSRRLYILIDDDTITSIDDYKLGVKRSLNNYLNAIYNAYSTESRKA